MDTPLWPLCVCRLKKLPPQNAQTAICGKSGMAESVTERDTPFYAAAFGGRPSENKEVYFQTA